MNSTNACYLLVVGITIFATLDTGAQSNSPPANVETTALTPAQPAKASPGVLNEWLRDQSPAWKVWDIGGQVRARYQDKVNAGLTPNRDFAGDLDNDDEYLLLREKVHVGYAPESWLRVYVESRDASAHSDERDPSPDDDVFDLHQGYFSAGDTNQLPVVLKVGRQEMQYGDDRFIGIGDWNNVGRSFDAGKLRFQNELLWVDLIGGNVVIPEDDHFNTPDNDDLLTGIYASTRQLVPCQETEVFFLARNIDDSAPATPAESKVRDIYMPGFRVKSLPGKFQGWDYSTEVALQVGHVGTGSTERDLQALAADATTGYTWTDVVGTPRFGAGYTYASGDGDSADGDAETFEPMFGTNHKFYGLMDLWGFRNIQSPRAVASVKPAKALTLATEYHLLWLDDTHDFFYPESGAGRNGNGYGRNAQFDSEVGSELDIWATYAVNTLAEFQLGYGHFFVGDYIEQSIESVPANGGAEDADWFYAQAKVNF